MSTLPGIIARRTPIVGPDNPGSQISADEWNAPLVVDSEAPDGSLIVRDRTNPDGWGFATQLPDTVGVPATRKVNGHMLVADIWLTPTDLGLGNVENIKLSTWGGSDAIATVGTITTGVWHGAVIQGPYGGTGSPFVQFTGPTALRTYTLPDVNATLFSTAAPIPPSSGGTGVTTGLTQLNASNLTSGIVPDARLSGNVARRDQTANIPWLAVNKAGSSLADLSIKSASDLTSGTLDPARLPPGTPYGPVDLGSGVTGRLPFSNIVQVQPFVLLGRGAPGGDILPLAMTGGFTVVGSTISVAAVTTTAPGLMPKLDGEPTHFLDGTGNWSTPAGTGGGGGGSGDVVGPGSAVSDHIATYSGSSGKVIKDGGSTIAQVISTAITQATNSILPIDLTTEVSGVLPVANGGTGSTTGFPNVVSGPATAGDTNVAIFNGTTGKVIKDSTVPFLNIARLDIPNRFTGTQTIQPAAGVFSSQLVLEAKHATGGTPAGTTTLLGDEFGATLSNTIGRVRLLATGGPIEFGGTTGPTIVWSMTTAGHLLAGADGAYDIGASGASRPRDVYISGTLTAGFLQAAGLTVTNITASGSISAGGALSGASLTTTGALASGDITITTAARPRLILVTTGVQAKGRVSQAAPNAVAVTNNLSYDGTNYSLDDTSLAGAIAHEIISAAGATFNWYEALAGANPRTPAAMMSLSTAAGLIIYENELVSKVRPEVQLLHTGGIAKARLLQHTNSVAVLSNNVFYDGANTIADDTSVGGAWFQLGAGGLSAYGTVAGANPRPLVPLFDTTTAMFNNYTNVLVTKVRPEVQLLMTGTPGNTKARLSQHIAGNIVLLTNNLMYDGANWLADDPTQYGMLYQHSANTLTTAASWYYTTPGANPRPPAVMMSLDLNGLHVTGNVQSRQLVDLIDGATVALDASKGSLFRLFANAARTISAPTNPTDGQRIMIQHYSIGGSFTLTLSAAAGGFIFGQDFSALTPTATYRTDYITCVYSAPHAAWHVVGVTKGF